MINSVGSQIGRSTENHFRAIRRVALYGEPTPGNEVGRRNLSSIGRREEGSALVEISLSLPIFLLVLLGIFKFGIAFSNQLALTQAVGYGAQYVQQIRTSTTDPCSDTFSKIKSAAPNLKSSQITVTVTMNGTTPSQSGNTCSGAQTNLVQGGPVSVTATYPCDLKVYGINFASSCQLQAQVTEYEY